MKHAIFTNTIPTDGDERHYERGTERKLTKRHGRQARHNARGQFQQRHSAPVYQALLHPHCRGV